MSSLDSVSEEVEAIPSTLADNPLLAVLVFFLVVVVVVAVGLLLRYVRRTKGEQFSRVLASHDAVGVLMHPDPDPDAMACALAVQELAKQANTAVTMYYPGQIRHHENRAFETVLDADFENVAAAAEVTESAVVLVDHNQARGFRGADSVEPVAVVDHHPGGGTGSDFTDVRTAFGSCASILSTYFQDIGWQPVSPDELASTDKQDPLNDRLSPTTATALLYGIQADTNHLTKGCSNADFEAAAYLYPGIHEGKLDRIANPEMDPESLNVKARAINNRDVRSAFAVSDVGTVSNSDSIPQAADELRRLEGVNAVVVLGDKDGTIRFAGRSNDDRVHMGKTLEAILEDIPQSGGGGHARMGGGQCSIEHMSGIGPGGGLSRQELHERLFAAMNGNYD
jgi:nanoRNase/pAp phosphatase (c-di-AMP/oligoRNAs hydrolase)